MVTEREMGKARVNETSWGQDNHTVNHSSCHLLNSPANRSGELLLVLFYS